MSRRLKNSIIYDSSQAPSQIILLKTPTLKSILKSIYPVVHFLQSFKLPEPKLPSFKVNLAYVAIFLLLVISGLASGYLYVFKDLPAPSSLASQPVPLTTHIRDRNGIELYKIYSGQNRTLVKLNHLPDHVKQATISIEDKDFYRHRGFSVRGTTRAAWHILTNKRLEGGSTITQQLVKTSLLTAERTFQRKLRELVLSFSVETLYTKDQILEMYLNRVSYGGATYGIEEAAQTYFGKSAGDLDLSQAALLAGLPASPTTYSPFGAHPELAKNRQKEVLRRMVEDGYITWEQAEEASAQELKFHPPAADIKAPHFVMYIKDLLSQKYGPDIVEQGGLDVITSLDLSIQEKAEKVVAEETAKVRHLRINNGAALVTNPQTGEILAMVGSRDYFDLKNDGNVNVVVAKRQPGSSIKPVNYALAFSRGFTPASIIDDSPVTYRIPGQQAYSPVNYDNRYHGRVTLRTALGSSYNIPAVKILSSNGVNNMIELGQKMGITTWNEPDRFGLSLTLGGGEVTMHDMAVVYGVFANQGLKVDLHPILAVRDSKGNLLEEFRCNHTNNPLGWFTSPFTVHAAQTAQAAVAATEITSCPAESVLDPKVAYLITDILSDNSARTPAFGPRSDLVIANRQVAVKTGTTNNLRDNWTIGYTPNLLVAVWVGNNDNSPMSYVASGVTGASPIWKKIISQTLETHPIASFTPPTGLIKVSVCTITGQLSCHGCPSKTEYFVPGTEPKTACTSEQISQILDSKNKNKSISPTPGQILEGATTQIKPTSTPRRLLPGIRPRNR